jgi:hypothetical protein
MTFSERVQEVAAHGFTDRQSEFLVTVMLHSGVCMDRQYCAFARIPHGRKSYDFFQSLVRDRYATAYACAHSRARIFHLKNHPLYEAIGEADNRFRRPVPIARAVERLMLLDTILATDGITWLATERDKVAHFSLLLHSRLQRGDLPHLTFGSGDRETIRYFPDKFPIGLSTDGRHIFTYLINRPSPVDFRAFLHRHTNLLRALPVWTVRLLVPSHLLKAVPRYEAAWREEIASPLRPSTADELRWYFEERRRLDGGAAQATEPLTSRFEKAREAFNAPRFRVLYRSWVLNGQPVLDSTVSSVLGDALARHSGVLHTYVLSHRYLHLAHLVTTA